MSRVGIGALAVDALDAFALLLLGVRPTRTRTGTGPAPGPRRCACGGRLPAHTHEHRPGSCIPQPGGR